MTVREINTKAGLGETEGEIIAMVKEISLVVPRGKYSLEFYEKQMRFHGETKSYYVEYRNVQRAFMLPLPMESQSAIVLQLIKPLLQGQTLYPFILIQIKKEIYVEVKTNVNR
jgi:structure-specific recognition protein 1